MWHLFQALVDRVKVLPAVRAVQELEAEALSAGAGGGAAAEGPPAVADDLDRGTGPDGCSIAAGGTGTARPRGGVTVAACGVGGVGFETLEGRVMSARKKLNGLYTVVAVLVAAFMGLAFNSWWAFGVTVALVMAFNTHSVANPARGRLRNSPCRPAATRSSGE